MPAATAEKRARQRANKLSQKQSVPPAFVPPAETTESTLPPTQPAASTSAFSASAETATPAPWPAPAPITFTISYSPLSVTYPEPENPAAKLPTDAVRITRNELALMLRQSYIHGTDHGWKANVALARDRLQADYEQDMLKATADFAEHEKWIREEEFNHGSEDGRNQCKAQLASAKVRLEAMYEKRHLDALEGFAERSREICDVEFHRGFDEGHDAGIRDEAASRKSTQTLQAHVSIQTKLPELKQPPRVDLGIQTETPAPEIIPHLPGPKTPFILPLPSLSVSNFISSLFEPLESTTTIISDLLFISQLPSPLPSSFVWSDEPSDMPIILPSPALPFSLPIISTSFPRRDFSDLHSGANPWQSLQHRKGRDRRRSTQPLRQRAPQRPSYASKFYSSIPHTHTPPTTHPSISYHLPPTPPAALDWDADPRLLDLSRILKTLGWAPPSTPRP